MYNEQFFQLFETTISDGELTPQEIAVLQRSAEAMGIDGEKFLIYYEARWAERIERLKDQPGGEQQLLAMTQRFDKIMAAFPEGIPSLIPDAGQPPQRKKAGPEQHEEIGKCPACKETINGLNHVCPSCGLVIDADHDTHGSLEEMLEEQEQLLLQAKALARNKAEQSDLGLDYLLMPFLMILGGAWYCGHDGTALGFLILIVMYLGAFAIYLVQKRSYKARLAAASTGQPLVELQERFEKNDRQIALYFGDDSKVGNVLQTLRQQLAAAVAATQAKRKNSSGYILVRLALFVPMVYAMANLPDTRTAPAATAAAAAPADERPAQIRQLLGEHNMPEARALLAQLPDSSAARPALLAALYEASQNQRLDSLRRLLPAHKYAVVRRGLRYLWWNEAATADTVARAAFEARKRMLNAELPAAYRLEEGWLTATGSRE
jgi:hypothetical protein